MTAPLVQTPGLYPDIEAEIYHADAGVVPAGRSLSSGGARKLNAMVPAKFKHEIDNPTPPTEDMKIGSAAHEFVLEGDEWPKRHYVLPEDYDGRLKIWRETKEEAAAAEDQGLRVIRHPAFEAIKGMADAVRRHPIARLAFQARRREVSAYWQDEATGIWCRCRFDNLPGTDVIIPTDGAILADLKTTKSVSDRDLDAAIWTYGYHCQVDWYTWGAREAAGLDGARMILVFVEKRPPYLVRPVVIDDESLEWAAIQNRRAREIFARCMASGHWPDYGEEILTAGLPGWARAHLQKQHEAGAFETDAPTEQPDAIAAALDGEPDGYSFAAGA